MILNESIEEFGYWWLPENPEKQMPGIIKCTTRGRVELEIHGTFSDSLIDEVWDFPIILGRTQKGKMITLIRSLVIDQNMSLMSIPTLKILSHFMFIGMHIDYLEDLHFSRAKFQLQGLDEWVSIFGISSEHDFTSRTSKISYTSPEPIEILLFDDLTASIRFGQEGPNLVPGTFTSIRQHTYFQLDFGKSTSFEEVLKMVSKINNLLCLGIDKSVGLTQLQVATPELKRKVGDKEYLTDIAVYYQSLPEGLDKVKINQHDMLFRYEDIQDRFEEVVSSWLKHYEKLEPAFNLYFSLIKRENLFLENKFLSLTQGLETLHRRTGKTNSISKIDHSNKMKRILENVPEEYREWLNDQLTYSYEPPLRIRLKNLIKPFSSLYGNEKARKSFIYNVVITRNYQTHFDKSLAEQATKGSDLVPLINKLKTLFVLHFLSLIGFNQTSIENIFQTNRKLNFNKHT